MKMCLAPCYRGCTDARYGEEAAAVEQFLSTRGESRLVTLRSEREQASANLEFESAATIHTQVQRVEAVRALAPELVRPLSQLRAVILQVSANPDEVAVFLFENGRLRGPAAFSTVGMRIQNEQPGPGSLVADSAAIEPIQELAPSDAAPPPDAALPEALPEAETAAPAKLPRGLLEARMEAALASLAEPNQAPSPTIRQGHLALLKRWYYRPEARRAGDIFFPVAEGRWPVKALLRGVGRVKASRFKAPGPGS
jgi:excinuclease UvrABC nuclease subunit